MRTLKALFLALLFGFDVNAANQTVTAYLTIVTNPYVASVVSISGVNVTWTNDTGASVYWVQTTNSTLNATTNLFTKLSGLVFTNVNAFGYTNSTNLVIYGIYNMPLTVTVSGPGGTNWATVSYATNTSYASYALNLPFISANRTNRQTNIQSDVIDLLNWQPGTNPVSKTAVPFTNFPHSLRPNNPPMTNMNVIGGTNIPSSFLARTGALANVSSSNMMATNLTGSSTNLMALKGTNDGTVFTNIPLAYFTQLVAQVATIGSGAATNMTNVNSPGGTFTNIFSYGGYISQFYIDNGHATNMQGTFKNPILLNSAQPGGAGQLLVSNYNSLGLSVINFDNNVDNDGFGNLGYDGLVFSIKGILMGAMFVDTNQFSIQGYNQQNIISGDRDTAKVTLGDPAYTITLATPMASGVYSNNTFRGTNQFNGEVSHLPRTYSTSISGYASAINLGTNDYIRITGASGAVTNASFKGGYQGLRVLVKASNPGNSFAFLHMSSIGAPAATELINLGTTNSVLSITSNPAMFEMIHDGEWQMLWHSN